MTRPQAVLDVLDRSSSSITPYVIQRDIDRRKFLSDFGVDFWWFIRGRYIFTEPETLRQNPLLEGILVSPSSV